MPHARLHSGEVCPCCQKGKVYDTGRAGIEPRIQGRPPLEATLYRPQRLRCNLCGEVFTAELPPGAGRTSARRCGPSSVSRQWNRRTIMPNAYCVAPSSGANAPLGATARTAADLSSEC